MLAVSHSQERHSGENVAEHMRSVVHDWKLDDKVAAIVTDNARNMTRAIDLLPHIRIGCCAHLLQL